MNRSRVDRYIVGERSEVHDRWGPVLVRRPGMVPAAARLLVDATSQEQPRPDWMTQVQSNTNITGSGHCSGEMSVATDRTNIPESLTLAVPSIYRSDGHHRDIYSVLRSRVR